MFVSKEIASMLIGCFASNCINKAGKCQPKLLQTGESNTELVGIKVRASTAGPLLEKTVTQEVT